MTQSFERIQDRVDEIEQLRSGLAVQGLGSFVKAVLQRC